MNQKIKTLIISAAGVVVVSACVVTAIVFSGSGNYDTVRNDSSESSSTDEIVSSSANSSSSFTPTDKNITITGDAAPADLDATLFVKKAYELKYLYAIDSFNTPNEISVNKLVQYAFCHLYYDSLVDMPQSESLIYRSASANEISAEISKQFNIKDLNVKSSDLYNSSKDNFEMWEPKYGTKVVATSTVSDVTAISCKIISNYYTDETKSTLKGTLTITLNKSDYGYYILSIK